MNPPDRLINNAAIVQLMVGLLDVFVTWWALWLIWGTVGGVVGLITSMIGAICLSVGCPLGLLGLLGYAPACVGFLGILAIPVGLLEIIAGVLGLTNPRAGASLMRVTAYLGCSGLLIGALPSAIGGIVVLKLMGAPGVRDYLDDSG